MKRKLLRALAVSLLSVAVFGITVNAKDVSDFTDVHENDWYYATVKDVAEKKLMTGLNETTFGPSELLARGQFACVLYRMEGSPEISYETIYPDVADGQFYSDAITWANKSGTITGYENGLYGVADNITREQLVTIMYRYAKASGRENVSEKADLSGYPDSNKVTAFAKEAMQWAVATGVIKGDGVTGELQPQGNVSRAVCATIISRYAEKGHWETINHPEEKHWDDKLTLVSPEEFHYETVHHDAEGYYNTVHHDAEGYYNTVHHDAEGYYNKVLVSEEQGHWEHIQRCYKCGADMGSTPESVEAHEAYHWDNFQELIQYGGEDVWRVDVPAVYEDRWVETKPAWDEQVWVETKPAWDEKVWVETKPAYDEQVKVVDKEAVYEGGWVIDKEAWTENVWIVE